MQALRLDKRLAATGRWSRTEAGQLVRSGRVTVDGALVLHPDRKVLPCALLRVDGAALPDAGHTYLMLNKPQGVLSATEDARQATVLDLLPPHLRRVGLFPVGRLDKDTEGLLLLTNDGALAHNLLAPNKHVDKVYDAQIDGTADEGDVAAFAAGMTLAGGEVCRPAGLVPQGPGRVRVILREGKFHQVKRMLAARGKPVLSLRRLSMGGLTLDPALPPGAFRPLTAEEVRSIISAI